MSVGHALAVVPSGQSPQDGDVERVLQEVDAPVGQEHARAARVGRLNGLVEAAKIGLAVCGDCVPELVVDGVADRGDVVVVEVNIP